MKTLALVAFGLFASGCLGLVGGGGPQQQQTSSGADMAQAPANNGGGGSGGSGGAGGGVGGNGGDDMAMHQGGGGSGGSGGGGGSSDMAGGSNASNVPYGGDCTYVAPQTQSNCATGLTCEQFANGALHKCTKACTMSGAQDPTECPAPSDGKCTPNLYCRFS